MKEYIIEAYMESNTGSAAMGRTVAELIRCKDCKYAKKIYIKNLPWMKQWEYSCAYFNTHSVMGDGFCSNAETKVTS